LGSLDLGRKFFDLLLSESAHFAAATILPPQFEQRLDLAEGKTEVLGALDEDESVNGLGGIVPVSGGCTSRVGE
jgi:hypothetical protein